MDEHTSNVDLNEAQNVLRQLAAAFPLVNTVTVPSIAAAHEENFPESDARYQTLIEQIPAVVFMAFLDKGIGEAYVSPQIEAILGYTQEEWLNDPVRWYQKIHPDDKDRWSVEAAELFLLGNPLKSLYRVIASDGRVVWFHCEAKMVRNQDGRPWFIHGVAFDITELKSAEDAVKKSAEQLQTLSRRLMEVQESERRNIALELHDEIGQVLTGLKLTLEVSTRLPATELGDTLGRARGLVNELMARVRKMSLDLRPGMLDDLGLLPTLLWHIENYTAQTNVKVNFKHSGLERQRFAPEVETTAYRVVQEALTNVARHARVPEVKVRVWTHQDTLSIEVADDGQGFDLNSVVACETSGLTGMRERAMLAGGKLQIESRPGQGTRLLAELSIARKSV